MSEISRSRFSCSYSLLLFFVSISLQFISGISGNPSGLNNDKKTDARSSSGHNIGPKIVIIFLAVVAVGLFSFFLFKYWQKKKREEQYARLLKLFEEDDELEVELGLRD